MSADLADYVRRRHVEGHPSALLVVADIEGDADQVPIGGDVGTAYVLHLAIAELALCALAGDPGNQWWIFRLNRAVGEAIECRRMIAGGAP